MASRGKRKNVSQEFIDDSDDPDDTGEKTKKKKRAVAAKAAPPASSEEEDMIPLSSKRFVSVGNFRGKIIVNIREYYDDMETGERKPGRKGISLTLDQWEKLKQAIPKLEAKIHGSD